jgi:4-aminobutyrate aminotransferase-like enzyme
VTVPSSWLVISTSLIIKKEEIDEGMEKLDEKISGRKNS